jgi:HNH endonuclease/AP2 domain-containing protein
VSSLSNSAKNRLHAAVVIARSLETGTKANPLPDRDVLLRMFNYDPDIGSLKHLVGSRNGYRKPGDEVRTIVKGYLQTRLFGVLRYAHRIIWKMMTGNDALAIDHMNRNTLDNRWVNLREVSHTQNTGNTGVTSNRNVSGIKGVYWDKEARKWRVKIGVGGKLVHIGRFDTLEDAAIAYESAALVHYGPIEKRQDVVT